MCKGKPPGASVATFTAGQVVNVEFEGSARHNGGICQFSLSYDNDQTFHVIQTVEGGCPDGKLGVRNAFSKLSMACSAAVKPAKLRSLHLCLELDQCGGNPGAL